jgi:hypothetical protein
MNMNNPELWDQLRTAYRPAAPDLDTAAIMGAIRREAAAHPLGRLEANPLAAIPSWACVAAASLAIFAAGFVVGRSATVADSQISQAWLQSVQLEEFEQAFLDVPESGL